MDSDRPDVVLDYWNPHMQLHSATHRQTGGSNPPSGSGHHSRDLAGIFQEDFPQFKALTSTSFQTPPSSSLRWVRVLDSSESDQSPGSKSSSSFSRQEPQNSSSGVPGRPRPIARRHTEPRIDPRRHVEQPKVLRVDHIYVRNRRDPQEFLQNLDVPDRDTTQSA